jgi:hypothetical protein
LYGGRQSQLSAKQTFGKSKKIFIEKIPKRLKSSILILHDMLILGFIVLFVLFDVIFVIWLSRKYGISPFNLKELMRAWKKEFN